jgi:hypothetical protein
MGRQLADDRAGSLPINFRVAAVAAVAQAYKNRQIVWRGLWHMPQQLGAGVDAFH